MAVDSGAEHPVVRPAADNVAHDPANVRIAAWTPPRFFDAAAGLPPSPACVEWLTAAWGSAWADPTGRHAWADRARAVLSESRARFASTLGCAADEVWFAPSVDVALATAATALSRGSGPAGTVLATPLERRSLWRVLDALPRQWPVVELPVDRDGIVDLAAPAWQQPANLAVVQAANREIGTRQPAVPMPPGTPLLVDASAVRRLGDLPQRWDALVLEPSAWGGPSGIAVVACRGTAAWDPLPPATASERFPGRTAVPLAAAAAMSLPISADHNAEEERIAALTDQLAARIAAEVPHVQRLGSQDRRVGHILSLSMLYVQADQLVDDLARQGFALHSGSACTSDTQRPSHVLTAIGALTHGNLRISLPPGCPAEEADHLATALRDLVAVQRREAGVL
jgi:cysteine desulfurase